MVVLETDEAGYALLTDGRERPAERPKRKSPKHFALTRQTVSIEEISTNRKIRKVLADFAGETLPEEVIFHV